MDSGIFSKFTSFFLPELQANKTKQNKYTINCFKAPIYRSLNLTPIITSCDPFEALRKVE